MNLNSRKPLHGSSNGDGNATHIGRVTIRQWLIVLAFIAGPLFLSGCGTLMSRTCNDWSFGLPVYSAVKIDIVGPAWIASQTGGWSWGMGSCSVLVFGLSLPFDVVLDTLFLPPDIIMGLRGGMK